MTLLTFFCVSVNLGHRHPDAVVESSTLSGVDPPEISYHLTLPKEVIDNGSLSSAQLEAVVYACQRHNTTLPNGQRGGFLIGKIANSRTFDCEIYDFCWLFIINLPLHMSFSAWDYGIREVLIRVNIDSYKVF